MKNSPLLNKLRQEEQKHRANESDRLRREFSEAVQNLIKSPNKPFPNHTKRVDGVRLAAWTVTPNNLLLGGVVEYAVDELGNLYKVGDFRMRRIDVSKVSEIRLQQLTEQINKMAASDPDAPVIKSGKIR